MYIINNRAGIVHGSYGKERIRITFSPGKNEIDAAVWEQVVKSCPTLVEHYLSVVAPVDAEAGVVVGAEEVDITKLPAEAAINLAKNTANVAELEAYLAAESRRPKARTTVLNAIRETLAEVTALVKKIEEDKQANES